MDLNEHLWELGHSVVIMDRSSIEYLITEKITTSIFKHIKEIAKSYRIASETFDQIFLKIDTLFQDPDEKSENLLIIKELQDVNTILKQNDCLIPVNQYIPEIQRMIIEFGYGEINDKSLLDVISLIIHGTDENPIYFVSDDFILKSIIYFLIENGNITSQIFFSSILEFTLIFYSLNYIIEPEYYRFLKESPPNMFIKEDSMKVFQIKEEDGGVAFNTDYLRKLRTMGKIQPIEMKFKKYTSVLKILPAQIASIINKQPKKAILTKQKKKIIDLINKARSLGCNFIILPEISCPVEFIAEFDAIVNNFKSDVVCVFPYRHISFKEFLELPYVQKDRYELNEENKTKLVNFIRICVKTAKNFKIVNQLKIAPYFEETDFDIRKSLYQGDTIYLFETNWGNFLFLICKDFLADDTNPFEKPIKEIIGNISHKLYKNGNYLEFIFTSTCNKLQKRFKDHARALHIFYPNLNNCISIFINHSYFGQSLLISPKSHHQQLRISTKTVKEEPLFDGYGEKGFIICYAKRKQIRPILNCHRLKDYLGTSSGSQFSPILLEKEI